MIPIEVSRLQLWNAALVRLGAAPIGSLDDLGDEAVACRAIYQPLVEEVLTAHPWPWAVRTDRLLLASPQPEAPWGTSTAMTAWHKPADMLALISIRNGFSVLISGWMLDGGLLWLPMVDTQSPTASYIAYVDEPSWPAGFRAVITAKLAARLALPLANDAPTARYLNEDADRIAAQARSRASQEVPNKSLFIGNLARRRVP